MSSVSYSLGDEGLGEIVISGITAADPAVVTATAHGFSNGDTVFIDEVVGMTEVNELSFIVANATANTFELKDTDSSGYTAYGSAGIAFNRHGSDFVLAPGEEFQYAASGTFVGTFGIESGEDGKNYSSEVSFTAAANGFIRNKTGSRKRYRFYCSAYTSGTMNGSMNLFEVSSIAGVGAKNGAAVRVLESGSDGIHRSEFTFTKMPVSVVSVTTGNGVGGTKFYDFPEGSIRMLGCVANLSISVDVQADFTDATPEGDIGIGTVAPANADALGTDATDDNFGTAAAFTMSAYIDADVNIPSEAAANYDGTSTPIDAYVNVLVDAADIDDGTTTEMYISGTCVMSWINLGDY